MPQGTYTPWSDEHTEILKEWMEKYPKGKSINLSQIKFAEPDKFQAVQDAGHNPQSMQDKAYAINYRRKTRAGVPTKPLARFISKSDRATALGDGRYKCNECGEIVPMKQSLPGHYRKHGGRGTGPLPKAKVIAPLTTTLPTLPPAASTVNSWHYCPNCSFPLDH